MKNIVIICFKYPPVYSGYGKQLKSIIDNMQKRKTNEFNITVLTAYKESELKTDNLNVVPLLQENNQDKKSVYKFAIKVLFWLHKHRHDYSFIHCIKAGPEAIASNIISKIYNKKLIIKIAQDELSDRELKGSSGLNLINKKARHKLIHNADMFISISDEIEERLKKRINKNSKIIHIPNGVDTDNKFFPLKYEKKQKIRQSLQIKSDEIVVLYIGAINERKGVYDLLEAFHTLETNKKIRCILCGPILEDINFHEHIKQINRYKNLYIDYRGKTDEPYIYMQAADIFVLPSYSEGLPNVLLEAGATGLPLIATDIGGSRDIILENKNGYLVSPNSPNELGQKIVQMVENKRTRVEFGEKARENTVLKYSLNSVTNEYINLYRFI